MCSQPQKIPKAHHPPKHHHPHTHLKAEIDQTGGADSLALWDPTATLRLAGGLSLPTALRAAQADSVLVGGGSIKRTLRMGVCFLENTHYLWVLKGHLVSGDLVADLWTSTLWEVDFPVFVGLKGKARAERPFCGAPKHVVLVCTCFHRAARALTVLVLPHRRSIDQSDSHCWWLFFFCCRRTRVFSVLGRLDIASNWPPWDLTVGRFEEEVIFEVTSAYCPAASALVERPLFAVLLFQEKP